MHIALEWKDNSGFGDIQVVQRKRLGESHFKPHVRLPHKATTYYDLGMEDNTSYVYRISTVSDGVYSSWTEVIGKTEINPYTEVFNVRDYGAKGNGTADDTAAIQKAMEAAWAVGGGTVYLPTGTYAVAPQPGEGAVFLLEHGNIFFKGDGAERTVISQYSPGLTDPETNWSYTDDGKLVRGITFMLNPTPHVYNSNFVWEDLRVTGNTRPTGNGDWWTSEQAEYGWDISHKGLLMGVGNRNILIKNTIWDGFRGEIIYSGDPWGGKMKIVDTKVYGTNSSAISTSADFECDNIEVWDAENACVESAFFKDLKGHKGTQNGIFRNSVFRPRSTLLSDITKNPILLPDSVTAGKSGLAVFNNPGSYMIIDNCKIESSTKWGILMDVAQHNFTIVDSEFIDCGRIGMIYLATKNKSDYNLLGAVENFLVKNCTFTANVDSIIWNTTNWAKMSHKDIHFKDNKVYLRNGSSTIHLDGHPHEGLRENFVFDNNEINLMGGNIISFTNDAIRNTLLAIRPLWKDNNSFEFTEHWEKSVNTASVIYDPPVGARSIAPLGPYYKIAGIHSDKPVAFAINERLDRYPEGFQTTIYRISDLGTAVLKRDSSWNDFPNDIIVGTSDKVKIKKEDSIFRLKEVNEKKVLSFRDKGHYSTSTTDTGTYSMFTGVEDNEEVVISLNSEGTTIEHNDIIRLADKKNFVHSGAPIELKFVRDGDLLIELERQSCSRSLVRLE